MAKADLELAEDGLLFFEKKEMEEIERVRKAKNAMEKAREEFSAAKESLKGVRGCIAEMRWQVEFYKENGRLP